LTGNCINLVFEVLGEIGGGDGVGGDDAGGDRVVFECSVWFVNLGEIVVEDLSPLALVFSGVG
jgi:hypothetical protein